MGTKKAGFLKVAQQLYVQQLYGELVALSREACTCRLCYEFAIPRPHEEMGTKKAGF
jgi:hypothetical protein